jgi:hypothetical protein
VEKPAPVGFRFESQTDPEEEDEEGDTQRTEGARKNPGHLTHHHRRIRHQVLGLIGGVRRLAAPFVAHRLAPQALEGFRKGFRQFLELFTHAGRGDRDDAGEEAHPSDEGDDHGPSPGERRVPSEPSADAAEEDREEDREKENEQHLHRGTHQPETQDDGGHEGGFSGEVPEASRPVSRRGFGRGRVGSRHVTSKLTSPRVASGYGRRGAASRI